MVRQAKKADIQDWTQAEADNFVKGEVASPCKKRKELEDKSPKKADEETSSGEDDPQKTSRAQQYIFKRDIRFFVCIREEEATYGFPNKKRQFL